jgi:hypothetical protein
MDHGSMDWIHLSQDRDNWKALVKTPGSKTCWEISEHLHSCRTLGKGSVPRT